MVAAWRREEPQQLGSCWEPLDTAHLASRASQPVRRMYKVLIYSVSRCGLRLASSLSTPGAVLWLAPWSGAGGSAARPVPRSRQSSAQPRCMKGPEWRFAACHRVVSHSYSKCRGVSLVCIYVPGFKMRRAALSNRLSQANCRVCVHCGGRLPSAGGLYPRPSTSSAAFTGVGRRVTRVRCAPMDGREPVSCVLHLACQACVSALYNGSAQRRPQASPSLRSA